MLFIKEGLVTLEQCYVFKFSHVFYYLLIVDAHRA